jgi:hypothetical protein
MFFAHGKIAKIPLNHKLATRKEYHDDNQNQHAAKPEKKCPPNRGILLKLLSPSLESRWNAHRFALLDEAAQKTPTRITNVKRQNVPSNNIMSV